MRTTAPRFRHAVILTFVLAAIGCKREAAPPGLPGDDRVLARVNGHAITEYDLMQSARGLLGPAALAQLDQATRKNLLEGLVQGRAIADKRETELSDTERKTLEKQLAAYRERLLVKQYLSQHTKPSAVSPALIARYYDEHAAEFTPPKVRSYELITSSRPVIDIERSRLLAALRDPASRKDWARWASELAKQGVPVVYQRGSDSGALLDASLPGILARLRVGEASQLTFVEGRAYLARVMEESTLPAKPLAQVSAEIRRALEPVKLQESVKQISEVVMKDAKVEFH